MRRSPGRFLLVLGGVLAAGVAVVGGLSLPPAGLTAIGLVAAAVGCLVGARVRESGGATRLSALEAGILAAGATAGAALVVAGLVVLAGGATATVIVAGLAVIGALEALVRLRAGGRRRSRPTPRPAAGPATARRPRAGSAPPAAAVVPVLHPVRCLSTEALGREWLLSTSVLGSLVDVGTRQSIVRRRQELLDELERRDPAGFARWLAAGPRPGSDPATYLHGDTAADKDAA